MASRKTLIQRFLTMAKAHRRITTSNGSNQAAEPCSGDYDAGKLFRGPLRSPSRVQAFPMVDSLRSIDFGRERIRLEGLMPPPMPEYSPPAGEISAKEARKLVKVAQMELVKSKLMKLGDCVSVKEFLRVCGEASWDSDHAREIAKSLDESGSVIVLGSAVFLRPNQVVSAIRSIVPLTEKQKCDKKELAEMEKRKIAIDKQAEAKVRRELWAGLCILMAQTAGFMRLTFWELSWDVMEPICFYVTSMYCMGAYGFFMKTSTEPCFEGFYKRRFRTKQRKLMDYYKFDEERYKMLKKTYHATLNSSLKW